MKKDRVLSGMQPNGRLHLGNFVGALQNWVSLQDTYDCYYFIADWHALTTSYRNPSSIKDFTVEMIVDWLSAGINPEKCVVFVQSWLPQHAVLHILYSMITPMAWLERNPTYKEKQAEIKDKDIDTYGFLGYPVLQAADILIYKTKYVPVGIDQLPHIEITREIARRFNHLYGQKVFAIPDPLLTEFPKLPGLDGRKMSKSYNNCIYLSDSPEIIQEKTRQMFSNPERARRSDPGNPENCNVYAFHKLFTSEEARAEIEEGCRTAGIGCTDCKAILAKSLLLAMQPFFDQRKYWQSRKSQVIEILKEGTSRASRVADETIAEVKDVMGF